MKKILIRKFLIRKTTVKEKEFTRYITEDLEISSDSDESNEQWFFFNKRPKKSHHHENFELCQLLPFLDYKEFFVTTLGINYIAY